MNTTAENILLIHFITSNNKKSYTQTTQTTNKRHVDYGNFMACNNSPYWLLNYSLTIEKPIKNLKY